MPRVHFAKISLNDMDAICDYISVENPDAARRLLRTIKDKCRAIAETPKVGRQRDEFGEGIRSFSVGSYLIFYRETDCGIIVARIIHGARNLPDVFHADE